MGPGKMRMWQAAEALLAEVDGMLPRARRWAPNSAEHLERSAESVLFNIAEGAAGLKPRQKILSYRVARKEANEVRAVLRRLVIKGTFTERDIRRAYNLAGAIIGMLTSASISLEQREERGRGRGLTAGGGTGR
jgi:four helix bundle protein